ncbi:iron dicitrate transporter FecR [Azorhizobium oxalatiphilum]|uniref:Iron dicitrate transporter FecR n=1 Tax=Azorhizobium oxalatiphilum TaxID=980631 RepID=A0A917CA68_9HYPH|nr:FecR domain-containing protein [Azorhizobium oxalatiphilum]GGF75120.1 iron dicitrate transporter FecR [Azorhizobium oxalatiphilum]
MDDRRQRQAIDKDPTIDRGIALDARDWIVRLTSGDVSAAELAQFRQWCARSPQHQRAFAQERAFWHELQGLGSTAPQMAGPRARPARMGRRVFLAGTGAAAVAASAALVAPRLEAWWQADYTTAIGQQAEIALPDGSIANLNTDSAIALAFSPTFRLVRLLKGEAEFTVRPDASAPFRVAALGGNSDATGTVFAVKSFGNLATVTVSEGAVRVTGPAAPDARPDAAAGILLSSAQQTSYHPGAPPAPAAPADTGMALAWRSGRVIFEGRPFASAIDELGRYVAEPIMLGPGVARQEPVSAIFSTADALSAVEAVARTQHLTVRRIPRVMILIT